ncbi:16S rRNA methyltransferase, partial [Candidatus Bathyarchaeota archaeon]|nr:16S rRNA methyltransferase [Candidatus Bathyarchaeota archaeon]
MINILFAETALELVPREILKHPSVTRNAKRMGKKPERCLLDRSLHHYAMQNLLDSEKRGRPDIIHFCLLEALGSPLNKKGKLNLLSQTYNKETIFFSPEVRLPRDCYRFNTLMEQLLIEKQVPPKPDKPLLRIEKMTLKEIIDFVKPTKKIVLTNHGSQSNLENVCKKIVNEINPLFIIGAYPTGPMNKEVLSIADETISIYPEPLETWVVTSRLIYEYEKTKGLM